MAIDELRRTEMALAVSRARVKHAESVTALLRAEIVEKVAHWKQCWSAPVKVIGRTDVGHTEALATSIIQDFESLLGEP